MKKVLGIILLLFGVIWTLLFLIGFQAGDASELLFSLVFLSIGVAAIIIGYLLSNNKKSTLTNAEPISPEKPYEKSEDEYEHHLTLDEVRQITAYKVNSIPVAQERLTKSQMVHTLIGLNEIKMPFEFESINRNGIDMIAHWKLADADYMGLLGLSKNRVQSKYEVLMRFDEDNGEIRCKDKLYKKESSFGVGGMGMEVSSFSGRTKSVQKEIVIGRKKDGKIGKVVDINLDTRILQQAIDEVAGKCGWEVKRVAGKL